MIGETMVYGKGVLVFDNPTVWYNPGNVMGVEMDGTPPGKMEEAILRAEKHMGFNKERSR